MPDHYSYEFRDSALYLKGLRGEGAFRVDPWPRPRSFVRLLPDSEWLSCPPPVRLLTPAPARPPSIAPAAVGQLELRLGIDPSPNPTQTKAAALDQFRAALPSQVADAATPFRHLQWDLLVACSHSDRFLDILVSNPALAYLWMSSCKARGFCEEGAVDLLAARAAQGGEASQRDLLRQLGVYPSKAAVKLLRKCQPEALLTATEGSLKIILRDTNRIQRLTHLPRLGRGIFELARDTRVLAACTPKMLGEVAASPEEVQSAGTARLIRAHLAMLIELGMPLPRPFRSRADLDRRHRELAEGFQTLRRELEASVPPPPPPPPPPRPAPPPRPRPRPVPPPPVTPPPPAARPPTPAASPRPRKGSVSCGPPPLEGNAHIIPLTTRAELQAEGRSQSNCVGSYFPSVQRGSCYIYKVLWPQRCTLSIKKNTKGRWKRNELKTARNRGTSATTKKIVDAWIEGAQSPSSSSQR